MNGNNARKSFTAIVVARIWLIFKDFISTKSLVETQSGTQPHVTKGTSASIPAVIPSLFIAGFLLCLYIGFYGRDYNTESIKYAVWNIEKPATGGIDHPWVSFWFWGWWQLVEPFAGPEFDQKMQWLTALNALLGTASILVLMNCLRAMGSTLPTSLGVGLLIGCSQAWFVQSSQTMDPMMAQFWLLLSWRLALHQGRREILTTVLSGLTYALSVAAYQSYVLAGPALFVLIATRISRTAVWTVVAALFGIGFAVAAALVHGANDFRGVLDYLFNKADGSYWGFIKLSAVPQVFLGMVNAFSTPWPPSGWPGLREGWISLSPFEKAYFLFHTIVWLLAFVAIIVRRPILPRTRFHLAVILLVLAGLFIPFYLLPYYSKLWLLPLSGIGLLVGLIIEGRRWMTVGVYVALAWMLARNVPTTYILLHSADNPMQRTARHLEASLSSEDLLICDGWDASSLYLVRNPTQPRFKNIFASRDPSVLRAVINERLDAGGKVFFYGLLELTEAEWNEHDVGKRQVGVPYPDIQTYSDGAELVWKGEDHGIPGDLYQWIPPNE
jgi:hypothetical protein